MTCWNLITYDGVGYEFNCAAQTAAEAVATLVESLGLSEDHCVDFCDQFDIRACSSTGTD